jgi:putative aminopeptidase FrvX
VLDLKAHLRALTETHAPSGHEAPIRAVVAEAWRGLVDSMEQDKLGSLIGIKKATQPLDPPRKIMLCAHMDEIGLMVADIIDGFIAVHRISGVDNRIMPAQPVMVHGRRPLPGVVAAMPPHLLTPAMRTRYPAMNELLIDVGLPPEEVAELVQIGDLITMDAPMIELLGERVAGKAMDDRACVAAVTVCLHQLQRLHHQWDVYAVASVQEETGLYGAATAAYQVNPDAAIALDVTFAPQPGVDSVDTSEMGNGVPVGMGPNFHPKMLEKLRETAKRAEIKIQNDLIPAESGTDAWSIQVAREGIPTLLIEVPIRNMHSPVETADLRDIDRAGRLMAAFIADLDETFLAAETV